MFDIAAKIKEKDTEAIALLYNRYGKKLFGYARVKWKLSEDDSWDMVYKTLYKVITVVDRYQFEDENRFVGFLFKVFINYLRNHYRDNKDKKLELIELTETHEKLKTDKNETSGSLKQSPLMKCLQKVLGTMEDWHRIILLMRAQDYSYEEIANYVDRPADQLKVYHMRLKKTVTERTNACLNKQNE
ncbi:MAG TPA: sigma-70 family RNA polymerase sigma factor [Bacteroidia bacterium]|nr:sigma-70 family RNA polymerase sigma factor [Bacteroidia bacterium]